jgi:hypothetical protein
MIALCSLPILDYSPVSDNLVKKHLIHTEYIVRIRTPNVRSPKLSKPIYEAIRKAINAAARKTLREYIAAGKLDDTFTADTR